jgi:two-component system, response regulator YesN
VLTLSQRLASPRPPVLADGRAIAVDPAIFSYYPRLQRVREYVQRNIESPISLRDAAEAANLERKYFSSFFHARVGVTFKHWLTVQRIQQAMVILSAHDESICQAAHLSGFRDVRTFERAFKRYAGVTPLAFKTSVRPS